MKSDAMLELLESAADQLGIRVSYEPLQTAITRSGSGGGGLCKVKGAYRIIIDKRATSEERVVTLATAVASFDTSALALSAPVREVLRAHETATGSRRMAKRTAA